MDKRIAAVIVTYNRLELLKECIQAIMDQEVPCDVLVVDNNSNDGTSEWLSDYSNENSRLLYHKLDDNLGGAGGFNHGMKWAVEAGYDYVWIMDDDCIVHNDTLKEFVKADKRLGGSKKYGFLSSVVLWIDGKECAMNRQVVVKHFYKYIKYMKYGLIQIQQATFVSLFFPAETIKQFGLPIKEYFIWGDDIEYTRRVAFRGRRPSFLVGKSQVTHKMKSNSGSEIATDSIERMDRYRMAFRNENYTYRQHGLGGIVFYLFRCFRCFVRIFTQGKDNKALRVKTLIKGFVEGCFFNPKVEYLED